MTLKNKYNIIQWTPTGKSCFVFAFVLRTGGQVGDRPDYLFAPRCTPTALYKKPQASG